MLDRIGCLIPKGPATEMGLDWAQKGGRGIFFLDKLIQLGLGSIGTYTASPLRAVMPRAEDGVQGREIESFVYDKEIRVAESS